MHVVKVCNPRDANFHVRTSARSDYWLVRDTTSYITTAYKALKKNFNVLKANATIDIHSLLNIK